MSEVDMFAFVAERDVQVLEMLLQSKDQVGMIFCATENRPIVCRDPLNNVFIWYTETGYVVNHRYIYSFDGWRLPKSFNELETKDFMVALRHAQTLCCEYERVLKDRKN